MIVRFESKYLKQIYEHGEEEGKPLFGKAVIKEFIKKVDILFSLPNSHELIQFKSLYFEFLKKEYKGFCSIRVNKQYRIIFKIIKEKGGTEIIEIIEIHDLTDYH